MASKIAVTRLQYPKGLWESAKKEYEKFLMENLYEVLLGTLEDPETIKWIAGQYLTPEKNPLTADKMSGLITEISKKHLPELLGMFMEIQRKKFGVTGLAGDEGLIARLQDIDRCPGRDPFRKFAFAVHDEDKLFLLDQVVDQFLVARECREKCDPDFPLQDAFFHGRRSLLMEFQPHMGELFLKTRV